MDFWKNFAKEIKREIRKYGRLEDPTKERKAEPVRRFHRRRSMQQQPAPKPIPKPQPFQQSKRQQKATDWQRITGMNNAQLEAHVKALQKDLAKTLKSMTQGQKDLLYGEQGQKAYLLENAQKLTRRMKLPEDAQKRRYALLHQASQIINNLQPQTMTRAGYNTWLNNLRNAIATRTGESPANISNEDVHTIGKLIGHIQQVNAQNAVRWPSNMVVTEAYKLFQANPDASLTQLKIMAAKVSEDEMIRQTEARAAAIGATGIQFRPSNGRG